MEKTIFHKILRGDIPCHKIYEDDKTFVFLDINPATKGHMLVIPKQFSQNIFDVDKKTLSALITTCKRMANRAKNMLDCDGCNILQSSEEVAEQDVPYIHFHVIPRYEKDSFNIWSSRKGNPEELGNVQSLLRYENTR